MNQSVTSVKENIIEITTTPQIVVQKVSLDNLLKQLQIAENNMQRIQALVDSARASGARTAVEIQAAQPIIQLN